MKNVVNKNVSEYNDFSPVSREDIENRGFRGRGIHKFYRLEMSYDEAILVYSKLKSKLDNSPLSNDVEIRNLVHPQDTFNFMFLYNAIFIAAPDPSRTITLEDANSFPSERTFLATLWHALIGFTYLTIEKDPLDPENGELVGAIAGIGVLPKYRGRKVGIKLLKTAIDYFRDKNVTKIICEVYSKNEVSLAMFKGMGMRIVGEIDLVDMQIDDDEEDKKED